MSLSDHNDVFSKTVAVLAVLLLVAIGVTYYSQIVTNEAYADAIINDVWARAEQRRNNLGNRHATDEEEIVRFAEERRIGRWGFVYVVLDGSNAALIKVETAQKPISKGVCNVLRTKFEENQWRGVFDKVMVVDSMGNEKLDILLHSCPDQDIPILRFYVRFGPDEMKEEEPIDEEESEDTPEPEEPRKTTPPPPAPAPSSDFSSPQTTTYTRPTQPVYKPTTPRVSCPSGTSLNGSGGVAISGCRCISANTVWNGKICEVKNCPAGSSSDSSNSGDMTNVWGCRCKATTPIWYNGHCVPKCSKDKIFIDGKCDCPPGKVAKKNSPNDCVECNDNSECYDGYECAAYRCEKQDDPQDCRWGVCQTCDSNGNRSNIFDPLECRTAGLDGKCNGNGTCYPTTGRRCSSVRGCPAGEFCNFGGTLNATKKQRGKFGQTPNVCQIVEPQEFTYKNVTYYYNTKRDLQSWCRAANNKPNCMWGYLAKSGAESWCASLGKRLLTQQEISSVWNVLKDHLPKTYTGYAYWVKEGAWIVSNTGKKTLSKVHPDGYGGKGGVICR